MMSWLRSWFPPVQPTNRPRARRFLEFERLEGRLVPAGVLAVGSGAGVSGRVALFHDTNNDGVPDGAPYASFAVFGPGFHGGVRVAVGNFVGDANLELVVASGPGMPSRVLVFRLNASDLPTSAESFQPFGPSFTFGLFVARAHTGGAAHDSLIVSTDAGTRARVFVFSDDSNLNGSVANDQLLANSHIDTLLPFGTSFTGGVRVAASRNLTAGAISDSVVLATGPGTRARLRIVKDSNKNFALSDNLATAESMLPVGNTWTGGLFVAVGDVGSPSANAELIVSRDAGSTPRVWIFADTNNNGFYTDDGGAASTFLAYGSSYRGAVHLAYTRMSPAAVNLQAELTVSPGSGRSPVKVFKAANNAEIGATTAPLASFFPFGPTFAAGYFVAFGGNGS
jgi:hypothetical protein